MTAQNSDVEFILVSLILTETYGKFQYYLATVRQSKLEWTELSEKMDVYIFHSFTTYYTTYQNRRKINENYRKKETHQNDSKRRMGKQQALCGQRKAGLRCGIYGPSGKRISQKTRQVDYIIEVSIRQLFLFHQENFL